jgi:hypothetical protein
MKSWVTAGQMMSNQFFHASIVIAVGDFPERFQIGRDLFELGVEPQLVLSAVARKDATDQKSGPEYDQVKSDSQHTAIINVNAVR